MERRTFLKCALRGGSALVAGGLAVPAVVTVISPALNYSRSPEWTPVGKLDSFPAARTTGAVIQIERDDWARSMRAQLIYVRRDVDGNIEAFSRQCTDLSCPVHWDAGSETFLCPCHGGIFNRDGEPIAGPPARPLFRFRHRVRDGVLEVDVNSVPPIA